MTRKLIFFQNILPVNLQTYLFIIRKLKNISSDIECQCSLNVSIYSVYSNSIRHICS